MLKVTRVADEEIFKTCLDYWHHFSKELYQSASSIGLFSAGGMMSGSGSGGGASVEGMSLLAGPVSGASSASPRYALFGYIVHHLIIVLIDRMAKPEEVLVVEDDNGEIVRESSKDSDQIAQYKTMREAIVYLTHLNYEDTESIMLEKLELQLNGGKFSWNGLNTLCWAIGSISGAMGEQDEKRFLVSVIKDLLRLCEEVKGKDNKAVVASNIMYIVGQYPRFLRAHWKFLKTVVNKLFEFMHEQHPGVQDMACDTFLKIAQKCKRKFMTPQVEDPVPFIMTLIGDMRRHVGDLQPHQVCSFYESVGTMLSDQGPSIRLQREEVLMRLMELPNETWRAIMQAGQQNVQALADPNTIKELSKVLRINTKVCASAGCIYIHQLSAIFMDALNLYRFYSEQIKQAIASQGPVATRLTLIKSMRHVKLDILDLVTAFFEVSKDLEGGPQVAMTTFMPALMAEVLGDYKSSPAAARDAKVLTLFSTSITVFRSHLNAELPNIMDSVFVPTLEMITTNFMDNPEHRLGFFGFLREANEHCFYGLFGVPPPQQKLIVDSVVWAFKHTERNVSETGLEILLELLQNIANNPGIAQPFYQAFLVSLVQDVLGILTDRLHKSGFKLQACVLLHIFHLVQAGLAQLPLFDTSAMPSISDNAQFLKEHVAGLLLEAFPNLTKAIVVPFIVGLFDISLEINAFKQHLRDFLIQVKEFAAEDNADLFAEETAERLAMSQSELQSYQASVPGLSKPAEAIFNDDDDL